VIENIDKIGLRTTTTPINATSRSNNTEFSLWSGFPIIKSKLTANINGTLEWDIAPSFVNDIENETNTKMYRVNGGFSFTPNPKLIMSLNARWSRSNIEYSINPDQNQVILSQTLNTSIKWAFLKKTFLESNFAYSAYKNERFDFDRKIPIWNASVRQLLTKDNKVEMRLAIFDILNERVSITQQATQNYAFRSVAPTLARYVMLSVSYNMRGYETKLKKNNWF
jgi:hypothetical protein